MKTTCSICLRRNHCLRNLACSRVVLTGPPDQGSTAPPSFHERKPAVANQPRTGQQFTDPCRNKPAAALSR